MTTFSQDPHRADIAELIDAAHVRHNADTQQHRSYLGASRIGEKCERMLAYEYHHTPKDPDAGFKPKTLRIFDMGHDGEERMASYIQRVGFDLKTEQRDGKQFGFFDADGRIGGHCDGVIIAGPDLPGLVYPAVWECKALGSKSWRECQKKGVAEAKPVYHVQMQLYMGYMRLESGLFTALNRDTGEIHVEVTPKDISIAQEHSDKALRVVSTASPEEAPKITDNPDSFACRFCDFRQRCHA